MSSCLVSVCLLVLLGGAFVSASHMFISENLRAIHDSIADKLGLKQPEIGIKPLFNTSCQRRDDIPLMKATLDVYIKILSRTSGLVDHVADSEQSNLRDNLDELQNKMVELEKRLSRLNHDREKEFMRLKNIEVDDLMVQKKALAEFLEVYQAASVTFNHVQAASSAQ